MMCFYSFFHSFFLLSTLFTLYLSFKCINNAFHFHKNPTRNEFVYIDFCTCNYSVFPLCFSPTARVEDPFKALVFDSTFDHYRGVVANIALFGGRVSRGDKIVSAYQGKTYEVNELGLLRPDEHPRETLWESHIHWLHKQTSQENKKQINKSVSPKQSLYEDTDFKGTDI